MITRRNFDPTYPGVLAAEQAIPLEAALPIFTTNGARSLGMEDETGALKSGAWADFIVLKENLSEIAPEEIGDTLPTATVWKGRIVHDGF